MGLDRVTAANVVTEAILPSKAGPGLLTFRRPRSLRKPTYIHPCDNEAVWTGVFGTATADATNWLTALTNERSVKLTLDGSNSGGSLSSAAIGPVNATGCFAKVRFYIAAGTGAADPANIRLVQLYVTSVNYSDYYNLYTILHLTENPGQYHGAGWYEAIICLGLPYSTGAHAADLSAIVGMRFKVTCDATARTPAISLDHIEFFNYAPTPLTPKPRIILCMDDSFYARNNSAMAYAAAKGVPLTMYLHMLSAPTGATNPTLARLKAQHDFNGHLVANHGYAHLGWSTGALTDAQKAADILSAADWLAANGFSDGARHFALPGGTSEMLGTDPLAWAYKFTDSFRLTGAGSGSSQVLNHPVFMPILYTGGFDTAAPGTTLLTNLVAQSGGTGATGGELVAIYGNHCETDPHLTDMKTVIDAVATSVAAGDVYAVTPADLV